MNGIERFNLRVYGIHVRDGHLLVTDEIRAHMPMTKLPGGGLEKGEGLEDGLKREWQEELATEIEVGELFFVNRGFLRSQFYEKDQVICFYYWVKPLTPLRGVFTDKPMDFPHQENNQQVFRWVSLKGLKAEDFTFPTDREVMALLKGKATGVSYV